jgi:hypothetical protein
LPAAADRARTSAQVILRWHVQHGHIVFPKSMRRQRREENFQLFDFELSDDEMAGADALDKGPTDTSGRNPAPSPGSPDGLHHTATVENQAAPAEEVGSARSVSYLDAIGYDALDIGTLADSWCQEPGTPSYVKPYVAGYPEDLPEDETRAWFRDAPNTPVSGTRLKQLIAHAVRGPVGGIFVPGYVPGLRPDHT